MFKTIFINALVGLAAFGGFAYDVYKTGSYRYWPVLVIAAILIIIISFEHARDTAHNEDYDKKSY